jgi:hypothetical protein
MVHEGQSLALSLKAGDDRLGVHAQLDDLEGNTPFDGFLLLGHVHHPAAALADLLEQFVVPDLIPGLFSQRSWDSHRLCRRRGRLAHEPSGSFMSLEQGLDTSPQFRIPWTARFETGGALCRRQAHDRIKQDLFPRVHGSQDGGSKVYLGKIPGWQSQSCGSAGYPVGGGDGLVLF